MAGITLVSVNIERSKHLHRVLPFLHTAQPHVVCIQELLERDIPHFEHELGGTIAFTPDGVHPADAPEEGGQVSGVGILSTIPIAHSESLYYVGSESAARNAAVTSKMSCNAVIAATIQYEGEIYRIATTHFTWTPDGSASDEQRTNVGVMLDKLVRYKDLVLTGDFNAPRGGEIFAQIAQTYADHVPAEYSTSIDGTLHRAGQLPWMVDGLFSTPEYLVSAVRMQDGVSDHKAIVANVLKRSNV